MIILVSAEELHLVRRHNLLKLISKYFCSESKNNIYFYKYLQTYQQDKHEILCTNFKVMVLPPTHHTDSLRTPLAYWLYPHVNSLISMNCNKDKTLDKSYYCQLPKEIAK